MGFAKLPVTSDPVPHPRPLSHDLHYSQARRVLPNQIVPLIVPWRFPVHAHRCVLARPRHPILEWFFPASTFRAYLNISFSPISSSSLSSSGHPPWPCQPVVLALSLLYILLMYIICTICLTGTIHCLVLVIIFLCKGKQVPMPTADITERLWNPVWRIHLRTVTFSFCRLIGLDKGGGKVNFIYFCSFFLSWGPLMQLE